MGDLTEKYEQLIRTVREPSSQNVLFDHEVSEDEHWWGMPDFEMKDARPEYKITMNFATLEDMREFAEKIGVAVTTETKSAWYPLVPRLDAGEFYYDGPKTDSLYPICIPSKGRADTQTTGALLERLGVTHWFFVEETEADIYKNAVGEQRVIVMPFHDLGQGSIPARNFIWDWAVKRGVRRHWTVDDNIRGFHRTHNNRRLGCKGGGYFRAMEDFVDRYENIAMAGPHERGFVDDRSPALKPVRFNSRVYSCILLDTSLEERWRGRYNEDTDLSIRLLKSGKCTVLFTALCMSKAGTVGSKVGGMAGGNTDNVYNTGDSRLAFAESLRDQHPDVVDVSFRYGRWHHQVDYGPFKKNKPILRSNLTPIATSNNYGMSLKRKSE